MDSLTSQTVVEAMQVLLAERRQRARNRQAAYVALARAILSDEPVEHLETHTTYTSSGVAAAA